MQDQCQRNKGKQAPLTADFRTGNVRIRAFDGALHTDVT
jgi:hypothetical protein